jgi:predicted DNA-binding transcriptional regulator YafY
MDLVLKKSLENQNPIMVFYIDRAGTISERIVRVERMTDRYVQVYCYWRKQFRSFKKENILSADPLKRKVGA